MMFSRLKNVVMLGIIMVIGIRVISTLLKGGLNRFLCCRETWEYAWNPSCLYCHYNSSAGTRLTLRIKGINNYRWKPLKLPKVSLTREFPFAICFDWSLGFYIWTKVPSYCIIFQSRIFELFFQYATRGSKYPPTNRH